MEFSHKIQNSMSGLSGIIPDVTVFFIAILSTILSYIESTVNLDSYHWGFMYGQAFDIYNGLVPHKDIFIFYGYLTSWFQGLALRLFGEQLQSIGIVTGVFYSLSLFLCYKVLLEFIHKRFAALSILFIFLIHGYIIFPWSNYFSYPLQLLSILLFIKYIKSKNNLFYIFLSGSSLGISVFFRYSSLNIVLLPYVAFAVYKLASTQRDYRVKKYINKIFYFTSGFLLPVGLFLQYLKFNHAFKDFFIQYQIPLKLHKVTDFYTFKKFIFNLVTFRSQYGHNLYIRDLRSFIFTLIFMWSLATGVYLLNKSVRNRNRLNTREEILLIICFFTLFGYLNSIHIYEVFRLANASSIGVGVLAYTVESFIQNRQKYFGLIMIAFTAIVCLSLTTSLIFSHTSSVYSPWDSEILFQPQKATTHISLLKGKIIPKNYHDCYHQLYKQLSGLDSSYYIVNYPSKKLAAEDSTAMLINTSFKRLQRSTLFYSALAQSYPSEQVEVKNIINEKKAIVFSRKSIDIPGYQEFDYSCFREFSFLVNIPEKALID